MPEIIGTPIIPPSSYDGWKESAILTVRFMIGDTDPTGYEYSDERVLQLFLVCANLVMHDTNFSIDYETNVAELEITPDPGQDNDFMGLVALRCACVLFNSEMRSKANKRVTMSDGPSTITMDNSELMNSLRSSSKSACEKYEEAVFAHKAGESIGVAIMGPYSPGSDLAGKNNYNSDRSIY